MPSKPGVLLVTTSPLLPLNSGGRIYTWGTTAPLVDQFEYHLIALATAEEMEEFERDKPNLTARYEETFETFQLFPRPMIPSHMNRREALRHLWFHTTHGLPFMDVSYYSPAVVEAATRLVDQGSVDVIEVDHAQLAYVRRFVDSVPAILINHNIEGDLHPFWMTDRWNLPELLVWRAFAAVSRRNIRWVEIENRYGFSSKLFISGDDAQRVSDECPRIHLPVPMEPGPAHVVSGSGQLSMLWLGGFDWPPNAEGLGWFLNDVLPMLAASDRASFTLHIVGSNPPGNIKTLDGRNGAVVHGYVDDITRLKAETDVLIAPLLSGSGVRVKVAEAMAAGMPVVATDKGAEGLTAISGRDFLLANTPEEFAIALHQLAESPAHRQELGTAAQAYIRSAHSPEMVSGIKAEALSLAIESGPQPDR